MTVYSAQNELSFCQPCSWFILLWFVSNLFWIYHKLSSRAVVEMKLSPFRSTSDAKTCSNYCHKFRKMSKHSPRLKMLSQKLNLFGSGWDGNARYRPDSVQFHSLFQCDGMLRTSSWSTTSCWRGIPYPNITFNNVIPGLEEIRIDTAR